ncbi:hypothetical protein D3C71_1930270 [compost metagenome]
MVICGVTMPSRPRQPSDDNCVADSGRVSIAETRNGATLLRSRPSCGVKALVASTMIGALALPCEVLQVMVRPSL